MMRTILVLAALMLLATAAIVHASEHERLPRRIQQDVLEAMGKSLVEDSSSDSITVVPHNFFAPEGSPMSNERSLLHAAESISHHVENAMEEATYSDYSDLVGRPTSEMVTPTYTQEIDPAFLIEKSSNSLEHDINEEEALEAVGRQAREYAEESEIGLLEESAEVDQPAVTVLTPAAQPAPKMIVVSTNEPTYTYERAPAPVAAPKPQYVTPQYKRPAAPAPVPAAPKSNVTYLTPLYKEDHPILVAQRAREARRAARRARRAARKAAREAKAWKVAPVIPSAHILPTPQAKAKTAAQFIQPALKRSVAAPKKRRCIRRDAATKKCLQRCRRCTVQAPKPVKQYFSPSFYYGKRPSKQQAKKRSAPQPDRRVLVQTPNGPVYVLYVTRHRKAASQQQASGPVAVSAPAVAFAQAPRAVVRAGDGARYVLPYAPRSPYASAASAIAQEQAQRAAYFRAVQQAQAVARARYAARRTARRQARIAAAQRLRAQQAANTVYDPKTHTIVRHNHHHHFATKPTTASVPTLRRAYVKLCRLQRAIMTKYNSSAKRAARRAAAQARRAARVAAELSANQAKSASAVNAAQALNSKYDSNAAEADALRAKYSAHLRRYKRAQQLIKRASAFLHKRKHERDARRAAIVHCRLRNHKAGSPVPSCGVRRSRRGSKAWRTMTRRQRRAAYKARVKKIRAAKKRCRKLARAAGVNIPLKCQSSRMSQNVFRKNRYDPKTNRVRFQQAQQTPEPAAATATAEEEAPVAPAAFQPVDGLDYNQSPLIKKLLAQLKAQNIPGL